MKKYLVVLIALMTFGCACSKSALSDIGEQSDSASNAAAPSDDDSTHTPRVSKDVPKVVVDAAGDEVPLPAPSEPAPAQEPVAVPYKVIDPDGMTLETRFPTPPGCKRIPGDDPGYAEFLRSLPVLPDGAPILLFNGELKEYQDGHVAVLDIDVGKKDLQQCADAAMRLRTEYTYKTKQYDKMNYHLTNGQELAWSKWRDGWRFINLGNHKTEYKKTSSKNDSYENYRKWLEVLMMYGSVDSIRKKDSKPITFEQLSPGDVIASVGHLIIVMDVVEDDTGEKQFLLAQSYMPAQQIEILKNPYHWNETPWYAVSEVKAAYEADKPFVTPEWEFPAPGPNLYRMP